MRRLETVSALHQWRRDVAGSLGLVPTMGFLHEGHLSLVRRARAENDVVAVSIFVNPAQFGPAEDFTTYPRDLRRDLALLEEAGVDLVFIPDREEIYPEGYATYVTVERLTDRWEGASRPGHLRGVTTVVAKLFTLFQPHRAYFGQKDYQQLVVVRRLARDLGFPLAVVTCPIIRDPDGLALSSRNSHLSPAERQAALALSRALRAGEMAYQGGERSGRRLREIVEEVLAREPLAKPDYVAVAHPETLVELEEVGPLGAVLCLAVWIGATRLIDNSLLAPS
jgi:pantoate--beta-alanine ligase